jgi:hypothetical protein
VGNTATIEKDAGAQAPVFRPMEVKVTSSFPAEDVLEKNIAINMANDWPRFHLRDDYGKSKSKNRPLAICAGGPSLKQFIGKIYEDFSDVMVCGSAHDFVVMNGIDPTYSVQLDGAPVAKSFFTLRVPGTQYLMASQCDPVMFEGLDRSQVFMWHCAGPTDKFEEPAIGGGCTTTLRAINLAIMLGYHDLHFFGFDSCFEDVNNQHAYDYEEWGSNLTEFLVNVDDGKPFKCNALFLAQAQQFQEMCKNFGHMFDPNVYGNGLIAEMITVGLKKTGETNE